MFITLKASCDLEFFKSYSDKQEWVIYHRYTLEMKIEKKYLNLDMLCFVEMIISLFRINFRINGVTCAH